MINHNAQKSSDFLKYIICLSYMINYVMCFVLFIAKQNVLRCDFKRITDRLFPL